MSSCSGTITTETIGVPAGVAVRIAGTDENRQTLAVKAAATNTGTVWLLAAPNGKAGDGWPLVAGEGYVFGGAGGGAFDSRGARVALYAVADAAGCQVHVLTEGA